jgi:hypothetical protein
MGGRRLCRHGPLGIVIFLLMVIIWQLQKRK